MPFQPHLENPDSILARMQVESGEGETFSSVEDWWEKINDGDYKRLKKKLYDMEKLKAVISLIVSQKNGEFVLTLVPTGSHDEVL